MMILKRGWDDLSIQINLGGAMLVHAENPVTMLELLTKPDEESEMSEARLIDTTDGSPDPGMTGKGEPGSQDEVDKGEVDKGSVDKGRPMAETAAGESMADPSLTGMAVPLTVKEWEEQGRLLAEYARCVTRDRKRAAEILPKIIWHAQLLKNIKRLSGADYIREEGLNTIDADTLYGPGWLDEDDGGPTDRWFRKDFKWPSNQELLREIQQRYKS